MHQTLNAYLDIISCYILNNCPDFKTNEPVSKKKFRFLSFLKNWGNADMAFCIIANYILSPFVAYFVPN